MEDRLYSYKRAKDNLCTEEQKKSVTRPSIENILITHLMVILLMFHVYLCGY